MCARLPTIRCLPQLLIVLAAFIAYLPALGAPAILDDAAVLDTVSQGSFRDYLLAFLSFKARSFAALTFRINYDLNHGYLAAFRLVNLAIHCANGLLVFGILKRLLRRESPEAGVFPALIGALIFALHPIQVQAVSYIAQRFALLASFFYLSCMWMYLDVRERQAGNPRRAAEYAVLVFFTFLAVMSKEIAITIPAAILLVEWIFPSNTSLPLSKRLAIFLPVVLVAAIPVFMRLVWGGAVAPWVFTRGGFSDNAGVSYPVYAATEMNVLLDYIRLILWPGGLHFIHDVVAARSFFDGQVILSSSVHLFVIAAAVLARKRLPLAALGALFFYLSHIVESFTVPLVFSMFEYRCYLSMAGVAMIVCEFAGRALGFLGAKGRTVFLALASVWIVLLAAVTVSQNLLYAHPVLLWRRSVALSPIQPLSHAWLAKSYLDAGLCGKAIGEFEIAEQKGVAGMRAKIGESLLCLGRIDEAIKIFEDENNRRDLGVTGEEALAKAYIKKKRYDEAVRSLERAFELGARSPFVLEALSRYSSRKGNPSKP